MTRLFYIALGVGVGVVAVRRVSKAAKAWTPAGVAAQAGGVGEQIAAWWADVQAYSAQREGELREALGITDGHTAPPDEGR